LAKLTRLFSELRDRYPDLPLATRDETTAKVRLYEVIVRLGQAQANRMPVISWMIFNGLTLRPSMLCIMLRGAGGKAAHPCQVAGLDEQAGLHALDELLQNRLLREETGEALLGSPNDATFTTRYFFAHNKVRGVVYSEAGDARQCVFHLSPRGRRQSQSSVRGREGTTYDYKKWHLDSGGDDPRFEYGLYRL
jgi:hypothetical protein